MVLTRITGRTSAVAVAVAAATCLALVVLLEIETRTREGASASKKEWSRADYLFDRIDAEWKALALASEAGSALYPQQIKLLDAIALSARQDTVSVYVYSEFLDEDVDFEPRLRAFITGALRGLNVSIEEELERFFFGKKIYDATGIEMRGLRRSQQFRLNEM